MGENEDSLESEVGDGEVICIQFVKSLSWIEYFSFILFELWQDDEFLQDALEMELREPEARLGLVSDCQYPSARK